MQEHADNEDVNFRRFNNWDEFSEYVKARRGEEAIFRGQRDSTWKLQSPWARRVSPIASCIPAGVPLQCAFVPGAYEANQNQYLKDFQGNAEKLPELVNSKCWSEDEWWALGRLSHP